MMEINKKTNNLLVSIEFRDVWVTTGDWVNGPPHIIIPPNESFFKSYI